MDKITRQVRIEHWTQIMNECLNSGMNKTEWCRANGISDKQFFYWQRILRKEAFAASGGGARHRRSVSSAGEPAGAVSVDARFLERFSVRTVRALERVSGRVEGPLAARHRAGAGEFLRGLRPLCYRSSRFSASALQYAVS